MTSEKLRIVAFSDYHIHDIDMLDEYLRALKPKPDFLVYAGDVMERFLVLDIEGMQTRERVLRGTLKIKRELIRNRFEEFATYAKNGICYVTGNWPDEPEMVSTVKQFLEGKNVYDLHDNPILTKDFAIAGIEGSFDGVGYSPFSDTKKLKKYLEKTLKQCNNKKIILVSHAPPKNSLDYQPGSQVHLGSSVLRKFIEKNQKSIPLVICGHLHSWGGKSDHIGNSTIVNVATYDDLKKPVLVASINIDSKSPIINWKKLYGLDIIHGIGPTFLERLNQSGIFDLDDLFNLQQDQLEKYLKTNEKQAYNISLEIKAWKENRMIKYGKFQKDKDICYLDIETDLGQTYIWLIGLHFEKTNETIQYFAKNPKQEKQMLEKFSKKISGFNGKIYTFSATNFDDRVIKKRMDFHKLDRPFEDMIDLKWVIENSFRFPLTRYGLKEISDFLGYSYKYDDLDGMQVAYKYQNEYLKTKDKKLLKTFLEYNEDDLKSLQFVVKKLS